MFVKAIPFIVKAAKIALHILPVAYVAEPYVTEAIHKKRSEKASCKSTRSFSR